MPFLVMAPFLVLVGSFLGFIVMVISTLLFFQNLATKIGHCKEKLNNFGASQKKL